MSDELLSPELRKHVQRSRVKMFARFATQRNVPQSGGSSCVSILPMRHCSGDPLPLIFPLICCVDAPTNSNDAEFATQLVNDENESRLRLMRCQHVHVLTGDFPPRNKHIPNRIKPIHAPQVVDAILGTKSSCTTTCAVAVHTIISQ